jgi:GGDEF domain-containing protein
LPLANREGLSSLEQLISRDQMLQMLDLILAMETGAAFALMRCRFRDYERVSATFGGLVAEEFINEGARRLIAALPRSASLARFADAELVALLPFGADEPHLVRLAERIIALQSQAYRNGPHSLALAVAIGIAIYNPSYEGIEAILSDTSMAVQMARRTSGSSFRFIDADSRVVAREGYRLGVPHGGVYDEVFNSDSAWYGGSNLGNAGAIEATAEPHHGHEFSLSLTLPPLAAVVLKPRC